MKLRDFILHLRLHYQICILSGGYLLGGVFAENPEWRQFWLQFINVHILLFGGATAFNSYWDKDEGPVGGLKNPPGMQPWMRDLSLVMQFAGLAWAAAVGGVYAGIYALSLLLFWCYSTPVVRWKGRPLLSLMTIGISTGTNSFLLGAMAAGAEWSVQLGVAAAGTACIVVSLYPVSQVYQLDSDRKRGDRTFALRFGIRGVQGFFSGSFITGVFLTGISLSVVDFRIAGIFTAVGLAVWALLSLWIFRLQGRGEEYGNVMKIKLAASAAFVSFIAAVLILEYLQRSL